MLLSAFWSSLPVQAEPSWSFRIATSNARGIGSNGYCPIAVDSNNNPHIAYSSGYAYWNGSGWSTQTISSDYDNVFSLVLDADDNPHVLFEAAGLKIASWAGPIWSIQTVDEESANYGTIALDSYGNPHVAYVEGEEIKYASKEDSGWSIQTIDKSSDNLHLIVAGGLSLALDSNNTPHIMYGIPSSYHDDSTGLDYQTINITLAIFKNSMWNIQTVPVPPPIGKSSNIVLDSKGYPHFFCSQNRYRSAEDKNLIYNFLYVSWDGTGWTTQTVASNIEPENYPIPFGFLSLDSYDYPHFVSFMVSYSWFMYASWTGVDWNIQNVDAGFTAHGPCYLAVGSDRIPHVSYRSGGINDATNSIIYATANEPAPISTLPSWFNSVLPLLLVSTAVLIGAVVTVVYVWKKKTKHEVDAGSLSLSK